MQRFESTACCPCLETNVLESFQEIEDKVCNRLGLVPDPDFSPYKDQPFNLKGDVRIMASHPTFPFIDGYRVDEYQKATSRIIDDFVRLAQGATRISPLFVHACHAPAKLRHGWILTMYFMGGSTEGNVGRSGEVPR